MKKTVWLALVIALVVVMPHSLDAQGKITSGPNAPGKQVSAPRENPDPRLAQEITYDSGYKRRNSSPFWIILRGQRKNFGIAS